MPFKLYEHLSELVKIRFQKRRSKTESWKEIAKKLDLKNGKVVEQH